MFLTLGSARTRALYKFETIFNVFFYCFNSVKLSDLELPVVKTSFFG